MRRLVPVLGVLCCVPGSALVAQQGAIAPGIHAGVLDDGRALLGGQIAFELGSRWAVSVGGTRVGGTGPGSSLSLWEANIRWLAGNGDARPYLLGGLGYERSRGAGGGFNEAGVVFGGGIEAGRGALRPFAEARGFKNGGVVGLFWGGLRVRLGRGGPTDGSGSLGHAAVARHVTW